MNILNIWGETRSFTMASSVRQSKQFTLAQSALNSMHQAWSHSRNWGRRIENLRWTWAAQLDLGSWLTNQWHPRQTTKANKVAASGLHRWELRVMKAKGEKMRLKPTRDCWPVLGTEPMGSYGKSDSVKSGRKWDMEQKSVKWTCHLWSSQTPPLLTITADCRFSPYHLWGTFIP